MNDDDRNEIFWGWIQGAIIGAIIFGVLRAIWWVLKGIWAILRFIFATVSGSRRSRRIATFQYAETLEQEGSLDEAEDMYRTLMKSPDPDVAGMAAFSLGSVFEGEERWAEAAELFQRAMTSGDPEVVPLATLGLADTLYFGLGNANAAEPIYRHLLRPSSQTLDGLATRMSFLFLTTCGLIHLLHDREEYQEAESLCRQLLEHKSLTSSDRLSAMVGLSRILTKQDGREEARRIIDRAKSANEDDLARLALFRRLLFRAESLDILAEEIDGSKGSVEHSA